MENTIQAVIDLLLDKGVLGLGWIAFIYLFIRHEKYRDKAEAKMIDIITTATIANNTSAQAQINSASAIQKLDEDVEELRRDIARRAQ